MSQPAKPSPVVLAAAAHPDDIEFCFAGTLLLLKAAGCEIHMWHLASGSCGSTRLPAAEISRIRCEEARSSAAVAGAVAHGPLFDDMAIFYDQPSLAKTAAVVRSVRPGIILTHSSDDYMEDHQNVCRLVVSAAFSRGMPNFICAPPAAPYADPVRIYHAAPHGHSDGMGRAFKPDFVVDTAGVAGLKRRMLGCHRSQGEWLEETQGMGSYLDSMEAMDGAMAALVPGLLSAEGWRRHSHLGFCRPDQDPLPSLLGARVHRPGGRRPSTS